MIKVNKYLLPVLYFGVISIMVMCVILVLSGIKSYIVELPNYDYVLDDVFISDVSPVASTKSDSFIRPYLIDTVKVRRYFYDSNSDEEKQKSSIIYYENTYMQNKGIDYVNNEDFDVVSVYDGEVINIEDNLIYGKVVTIKHNDNLITTYSNLTNVLVNVGYKTAAGEIIGSTTKSQIDNDNVSLLHFEVLYQNKNIDPESIYTLNVSQMQ